MILMYIIGFCFSLVAIPIGPILWTFLFLNFTKNDREIYRAKNDKYSETIRIIEINIQDKLEKGINIFEEKNDIEGLYRIGEGVYIYEEIGDKISYLFCSIIDGKGLSIL